MRFVSTAASGRAWIMRSRRLREGVAVVFEERIAMLNEATERERQSVDEPLPGKRTYTVEEIQDILDISRPTAYNLVKKGEFHSVRVGGHIRISKKSFDEWLDRTR